MTQTMISSPYTFSDDCHVVGHDGFVIPKDFSEFYERFPRYVHRFVRLHWTHASGTDREDREQELLMHLPECSKYRQPGFNGLVTGCRDRVQVFQPDNTHGASKKLFFRYINLCLRSHAWSQGRKANSNPVRRSGTMRFDEHSGPLPTCTQSLSNRSHHMLVEQLTVDQFLAFVEKHNPELLLVLATIGRATTFTEAQRMLDMTDKLFIRARSRLVVLFTNFANGSVPPRERKVRLKEEPCAKGLALWKEATNLERWAASVRGAE